jgi:uncharacterized protein (DUF1499 family)
LARVTIVAKLTGFYVFLGGGAVAAIAAVLGLAVLWPRKATPIQRRWWVLFAVGISLAHTGVLVTRVIAAAGTPFIHDVTTDLVSPPQFTVLPLRPDNLTGVGTVQNWKRVHARAYREVLPVTLALPMPEATSAALRLVRQAGWTIVSSDVSRGQIEATASVSWFGFYDDVIIRVTPGGDAGQSIVDMRSVSRVGVWDMGVNAQRIREFLRELAQHERAGQPR